MEESHKKARKRNWDSTEKTLLVHLVGDKIDIIEKKRNDFQANSAKIGAWEEIFREFRARYGERRSLKELRDQWKRIKLAGKAEWADFSKKRRMTGGGEPPHQPSGLSVQIPRFRPLLTQYNVKSCRSEPTLSTITDATSIHPSFTSASSHALHSTCIEVTPEKRSDLVQPTLSTTTDANIIHPSITSASSNALRSTSIEVTPEKRSDLVQPTLSTTTDANIIHPSITSASTNALRSTSVDVTPVKRNSQTKRRVSTPAATTSSPSLEETLKLHAEEEHCLKIEEHRQRMKFLEDEQRIKLGYLEEQQKVKMEILQMKNKVQQRKLDLMQNQQDSN
nr:uncharacterized protein LOC129258679 [Lytechinus pictus]